MVISIYGRDSTPLTKMQKTARNVQQNWCDKSVQIWAVPRFTTYSASSLFDLPDADNVSHFVEDELFQLAIRLNAGDVFDVEGHRPRVAHGLAGIPNPGRACKTEYGPYTVDRFQRGADREKASLALGGSSARHVGDNLGPPAHTIKFSGALGKGADCLRASLAKASGSNAA